MRVALAQTDMVWEDKKASIQKAEKMVSEAAKSKTDRKSTRLNSSHIL